MIPLSEDRIVRLAKDGTRAASDGGPEAAADQPAVGKDDIFGQPQGMMQGFKLGAETAAVFDDMVSRSVPFYDEIQRMS